MVFITNFFYRLVHVGTLGVVKNLIFKLEKKEGVMGFPRLLFVIITGILCVMLLGCIVVGITIYQARRKNSKNYYSFSLLPQKSNDKTLFEDDEDDNDEMELFRSPIKSEIHKTCCFQYLHYYSNFRKTIATIL